jgi:hypothetical protein
MTMANSECTTYYVLILYVFSKQIAGNDTVLYSIIAVSGRKRLQHHEIQKQYPSTQGKLVDFELG